MPLHEFALHQKIPLLYDDPRNRLQNWLRSRPGTARDAADICEPHSFLATIANRAVAIHPGRLK